MNLRDIQRIQSDFEQRRGWDRFPASLVYVHLMEEIGEIGRHILFDEGYKVEGLGHTRGDKEIGREFAQVFSLLLQLANRFGVDLEEAYLKELDIMERRFDEEGWREYMDGRR